MKAQSIGKKYKEGFATLEVLIAFAVLILCISAVIMISFGNQSIAVDSQISNEAISKAQALLEKARADSRQDFNLVNPILPNTPSGNIYTENLDVTQTDLFTKKVTSTVSWQTGEKILSTVFTTLLTNPEAVNGGDTCSSVLTGDWKNPKILNISHTIDITPNNLTGIAVNNNIAYITGFHSGTNLDLFLVDVSDPTYPKILGSTDTSLTGLAAVVVAGKYAYVANRSTTAQLQVVNIEDPYNIPAPVASKKVVGAGGIGNTIFYYKNTIYLGLTANGAGPQFAIFDVSTPTNPIPKGIFTLGHDVNAIRVKDHYAYVASPDSEELKIFYISNDLMTVTLIGGSGVLPDTTANGKSVYIVGNTAYLGRAVGLGANTKQFYQFDVTSHAVNPLPILGSPLDISGSINNLIVRSSLAFFVTNSRFEVWTLLNLGNIYGSLPLSSVSPSGSSDCEGNLFYIGVIGPSGSIGQDVLQIIGPS